MNMADFNKVVKYKTDEQIVVMAIEEMAELTQALTKYLRKDNTTHRPKELSAKITEEYADVTLLMRELQCVFYIPNEEVDEMMDYKMDRWLKRNGYRDEEGKDKTAN